MIRSILVALILIGLPLLAQAQQTTNPAVEHRLSVSTGVGFASSVASTTPFNSPLPTGASSENGFLWQIDALYRATDTISGGMFMQTIPVTGGLGFAWDLEGRYHFNLLHSQSNDVLNKLTPYAGLGMGLWHYGNDADNVHDNAFLFSMIFGIEYDLSEHVALTSDMRLNILGGTEPVIDDHFYYSWQIIGARYRF